MSIICNGLRLVGLHFRIYAIFYFLLSLQKVSKKVVTFKHKSETFGDITPNPIAFQKGMDSDVFCVQKKNC